MRVGSSIAISVRRFEHDALLAFGAEFEGGVDELMALHIIRQIDKERLARKEHQQLISDNNIWSAIDRPDEPSFQQRQSAATSPGGKLYPFTAIEDREPEEDEPEPELPEDRVRLHLNLQPIISDEINRFLSEAETSYGAAQLIKYAVDSALMPADIE